MAPVMLRTIFAGAFQLIAVCALSCLVANAAEIRNDPSRGAEGAVLEGRIEVGDSDKLLDFIFKSHGIVEIYLASPGGNLIEAMKLGRLIRLLDLSTVVPGKPLTNQDRVGDAAQHALKDPKANSMCASACFFVFVAGIHRTHDVVGPAILGIHRPFASTNDSKTLGPDQVTVINDQVRTAVENYLKEMGVPKEYAVNMFSVPKGRIRWVRNDEFEADFEGFISDLRDVVNTRCERRRSTEKMIGQEPKSSSGAKTTAVDESMGAPGAKQREERSGCERKVQEELAVGAFDAFSQKSSTLQ
jgi:hypothetical protein